VNQNIRREQVSSGIFGIRMSLAVIVKEIQFLIIAFRVQRSGLWRGNDDDSGNHEGAAVYYDERYSLSSIEMFWLPVN
jgi:hypothetical protein